MGLDQCDRLGEYMYCGPHTASSVFLILIPPLNSTTSYLMAVEYIVYVSYMFAQPVHKGALLGNAPIVQKALESAGRHVPGRPPYWPLLTHLPPVQGHD